MIDHPFDDTMGSIEVHELTKYYFEPMRLGRLTSRAHLSQPAVDHVSLYIKPGELFGLIGPNGAGKTTLIKMLATLIVPTDGWAKINGHDLLQDNAVKASIGLVTSDERSFFWRLTGRQNLEFFAQLHNLPHESTASSINETLESLDLAQQADKRFMTYSTGMRQRLAIARAMLHHPRILFLDEPTRGLDPASTQHLRDLIRNKLVDQQGITVLMTTHDLDEASRLCDRIAILYQGKVRACGSLEQLRATLESDNRFVLQVRGLSEPVKSQITQKLSTIQIQENSDNPRVLRNTQISIPANHSEQSLNSILDILRSHNIDVVSAQMEQTTLDEIFNAHTSSIIHSNLNSGNTSPSFSLNITTDTSNPRPGTNYSYLSNRSMGTKNISIRLVGAFIKRDFLNESSYPFSFILQILNVLFSTGVFYFISRVLDGANITTLAEFNNNYFAFVLTGIAFAGYFNTGLSSFAGSIRQAQTTGTLEAMLTTPTRIEAIILSSAAWDYLFTTIRLMVYLGAGMALFGLSFPMINIASVMLVITLTILSFGSIGIIAASFIMILKRGDPITWLFGAFSNFLGGVYYPVSILPAGLQWIAGLLPITYGLDALRKALLQGASIVDLLPQITALIIFSIVLLPLSLYLFMAAVKQAKIDGSLSQY